MFDFEIEIDMDARGRKLSTCKILDQYLKKRVLRLKNSDLKSVLQTLKGL